MIDDPPAGGNGTPGAPGTRASGPRSYATLLRRCRLAAGLTQEALAERSGVSLRAVQGLEQGPTRPQAETARRLVEALSPEAELRAALEAAGQPAPRRRQSGAAPLSLGPGHQPARPTRSALPGDNLPRPRSRLVGREDELAVVEGLLLDDAVRLVTLTGVGGGGKTRLALQVAAGVRAAFADGAWIVDLSLLSDATLVPGAIGAVLGVPAAPGTAPPEALPAFLRHKALLLVLDNCEHVLQACVEIAERVLDGCPEVRLLATSREPLRVPGEHQFRVPPLAGPEPDRHATVDELQRYPAVQLFAVRAQAVAPEFRLTEHNATAVGRVCARLAGIPLALELAAAQTHVLSLDQIADRLDDSLRLLAGGCRTAPTRQQTLRAALDWSFALLTAPERALFRRLAVFAGGCDLEAVEAISGLAPPGAPTTGAPPVAIPSGAALSGAAIPTATHAPVPQVPSDAPGAGDALAILGHLVDKSLVIADTTGAPERPVARYRLLEPVRQYAAEQLRAAGEEALIRRRHAAWCAALLSQAERQLAGTQQGLWIARLEREHGNLRLALDTLAEAGDADGALRLCATLGDFWAAHGHLAEGRQRIAQMLALPGAARSPARVVALLRAGSLAGRQGDYRAQERYDTESLALARERGDRQAIAATLCHVASAVAKQGRYDAARASLEEALTICQALGDTPRVTSTLMRLGALLRDLGEFDAAAPLFEQCLATQRALNNQLAVADTLSHLGWLSLYRGDLTAARVQQEESLALRRDIGDTGDVGVSLTILGLVAAAAGDRREARRLHAQGLAIHRQVGNTWGTALALEGLAAAVAPEHASLALRLAGAADALRRTINRPLPPAAQPLWTLALAPAHRALSAAAASAFAAGQAWRPEEAVAAAEAATRLPLPQR